MRFTVAVVTLASLVLTAPAATANGPARSFSPVAEGAGPLLSDGVRYVVVSPAVDRHRVIDTATGTSFEVPTPAQCATPGLTLPRAIGGGRVLWQCPTSERETPVILDIATRTFTIPPRRDSLIAAERGAMGVRFDGIGARWIQGHIDGYHYDTVFFFDYGTGDFVGQEPQGKADTIADLDALPLERAMCPPLQRKPIPDDTEVTPPFFEYSYDPPYGLAGADYSVRSRLFLHRCGEHAPVLVDQRATGTEPLLTSSLSAGFLTWSSDAINAYLPEARERFSWRAPFGLAAASAAGDQILVAHTANTIFVSRGRTGPAGAAWSVYRVPRPVPLKGEAPTAALSVLRHGRVTPARFLGGDVRDPQSGAFVRGVAKGGRTPALVVPGGATLSVSMTVGGRRLTAAFADGGVARVRRARSDGRRWRVELPVRGAGRRTLTFAETTPRGGVARFAVVVVSPRGR